VGLKVGLDVIEARNILHCQDSNPVRLTSRLNYFDTCYKTKANLISGLGGPRLVRRRDFHSFQDNRFTDGGKVLDGRCKRVDQGEEQVFPLMLVCGIKQCNITEG
jgi:hypothetical protein